MESPRQHDREWYGNLSATPAANSRGFTLHGKAFLLIAERKAGEVTRASLRAFVMHNPALNLIEIAASSFSEVLGAILSKVNEDNPMARGYFWDTDRLTFEPCFVPHGTIFEASFELRLGSLGDRLAGLERPGSTIFVTDGLIKPGKMVYADQDGNLVGSSGHRPLGVTEVDSVTHGVGPGVIQTTGEFEFEFEVATKDGPMKVRSSFKLLPGCRVAFFSAPGKQHSATVAPDGKTLIDVTPPLDTNFVATTSIGAMPPGDMPVIRGVDPESKTIKNG